MVIIIKTIFLKFILITTLIADIEVSAIVDDSEIYSYETINFKIISKQSQNFPKVDISNLLDFEIISGPSQSSSFQWVNGKMTSTKSLSWTIAPKKVGILFIPKFEVNVDGKKTFTSKIEVKVFDNENSNFSQENNIGKEPPLVFIIGKADKIKIIKGEQINIEYKLYSRTDLRQYSFKSKPKGKGFWKEELYEPKQPSFKEIDYNGLKYNVATIYRIALFPTNSGKLELNQLILNCSIQLPSSRRDFSLFNDFFSDSFFSRTQEKIIASNSLLFEVADFPELEKPENFSGAVGIFNIFANVDTKTVKINDPITMTIKLNGTGNLNLFEISEPYFPSGLEVFPPKSKFTKDPFRDKISGSKILEYVIIPRNLGKVVIPAIKLFFFNPEESKWDSSKSNPILINVISNKLLSSKNNNSRSFLEYENEDIRYINEEKINFKKIKKRTKLIPNLFWLINFVSVFIITIPFIEKYYNKIFFREKTSLKIAKNSILNIKNDNYKILSNSIYNFLSYKFKISHSQLNRSVIREKLSIVLDKNDLNEIDHILKTCEEKRFSNNTHLNENFNEISNKTINFLMQIDKKL